MKAYTTIEQSKKLAKILPLESADMKWYFWKDEIDAPKTPTFGYSKTAAESYKDTEAVYLPCWSLAALLESMPKQIGRYTKSLYWFDNAWHCDYMDEDSESKIGVSADNSIDACIKMIYKLEEICAYIDWIKNNWAKACR